MKLSVALATYNEEANLDRCLSSVKDLADEIVIVDGNSTDATVSIAKKYGAKVVSTTNKPIFHINKQMAVEACKGEWILALDADEVVTPELAVEIQQVMDMDEDQIRSRRQTGDTKKWRLFDRHQSLLENRDGHFNQDSNSTDAFFLPRLNLFLGHPMRHTGVYPDAVIRLFRSGKAKFPAQSVHEQLSVVGRVDWLTCDLLHYDSPTFSKYMLRANRYTSLSADELARQKLPITIGTTIKYVVIKPTSTFLQLFIRHKGFLDGWAGFVFSLMSGLHWSLAWFKYYEITSNKRQVTRDK